MAAGVVSKTGVKEESVAAGSLCGVGTALANGICTFRLALITSEIQAELIWEISSLLCSRNCARKLRLYHIIYSTLWAWKECIWLPRWKSWKWKWKKALPAPSPENWKMAMHLSFRDKTGENEQKNDKKNNCLIKRLRQYNEKVIILCGHLSPCSKLYGR